MVKMDYVWDRTVEFLGDNLSSVLPFAVLGLFVPTSIMNALSPLWQDAGEGQKAVLTFAIVALVAVMFWGTLAITALAIDPATRGRAGAVALARLPAMVGAYALLIVGIVALAIPLGVLAGLSGLDMAAMSVGRPAQFASPVAGAAAALYFLAFIAVMVVVLARIMPIGAVVMAERRGAGAIARAWRLTRGMTWRLIGVTILYAVVSQVAGLAARTVFGSLLRLVGGGDGPVTVGSVVTGVIVAAISAGFSTLAAVFAAKLYVAVEAAAPPPVPATA